MRSTVRPMAAEFLGTFALVFIGGGAVVVNAAHQGLGLTGIALAHAVVLAVMVTVTMRISGGHLNPAVTFGVWMAGKISLRRSLFHIASQIAAGIVAALAVRWLLPAAPGAAMGYGVPRVAAGVSLTEAILLEGVLTLFLVSAVFGTAVSRDAPQVGGFAIGLVLLFDIMIGGNLTGAAMNPARAFGPALVANEWTGHLIYWIGPLFGAAVAGFLWSKLLLPIEGDEPA
ncbi:MAG TPA: aquaporin [Gemmatimonadales bacterium]